MLQDKIYSYFDGNPQLRVLFVFDGTKDKLTELEAIEWREGYHLEVFHDDWFTIKYKLTHDWKDEKIILFIIGMTAPSKCDSSFLLYGEMKANAVYSDESYISFMHQKGIRSEFAPYISRHIAELQLSKFDRLLADYYKPGIFSEDICNRAFISVYIGATKLMDWPEIIIRLVCLYGLESEAEKKNSFIRSFIKNVDAQHALEKEMMNTARYTFEIMSPEPIKRFAQSFKYNSITQNLPIVQADDYKDLKISDSSVLKHLNSLRENAKTHNTLSEQFSKAIERLGCDIKEENIIRWYGPGAEYTFVTDALCALILKAIVENREVFTSPTQTNAKLRSMSLMFSEKTPLKAVIDFMSNLCSLNEKLQSFETYIFRTPYDYIIKYVSDFYMVDTYYRKAIDSFSRINPSLSIYDIILSLKNDIDELYATQCNLFNQEWIRCVNESGEELAYMKGISHQQNFYDEKLKGMNTKRVVIISDALRYEVANEIHSRLGKDRHSATLDASLAILPTETKYSKMTLLPHSSLEYNDGALLVDGEDLNTTEKRSSHVKKYEPGALCIDYNELMKLSQLQKRELFKSPLVYVFHDTIDSISHDNPHKTAQACKEAVEEISQLIPMLHSSCNVTHVFVTSDHGFLFNDVDFEEKDKHKINDSFDERKTRYYITDDRTSVMGISKFSMEKVSFIHSSGKYVATPNGTNRLYAEGGGYEFAHGGATLQEMIIPVLYSHNKKEGTKPKVGVIIVNSILTMVSSRLKVDIIQSEPVSADFRERTIVCGVYEGNELLTPEKEIVLNSIESTPSNRVFSIELVLNKASRGGLLELRIYDTEDRLNTLVKATVTDKTLIEQDF